MKFDSLLKPLLVCFFLCLMGTTAWAQRQIDESGGSSAGERLYFGGGLGFASGISGNAGRYTYIGVYPILGYMVTNQFSVGTTFTYQYYSYPDIDQYLTQYGVSPFLRYNFNQVFLYSEYTILSSPTYDNSDRKIYDRLALGVGVSQPLGKGRTSINGMGLYDVLYDPTNRAFASPWVFRVFFTF